MLFNIVNPSDPYTVEAPSLDVAAVASLMVGQGQYSFASLDGSEDVPMFAFMGNDDTNAWFKQHCGDDAETVVTRVTSEKKIELADCLDSVIIGHYSDRQLYLLALSSITDPANREKYIFEYHDKKRSSMNDIGGRARQLAAKLRGGANAPANNPS